MSSAADARPVTAAPAAATRRRHPQRRAELLTYLGAAVTSIVATAWILRIWRADLRVPFFYEGNDSTAVAAHFKTVLETGWYEFQPALGAPAGQHYHDFPTADNLHLMVARVLGLFTDDFAVAMNTYYLLGFPLAALTATYFLRTVGVSRLLSIVLATLFAVAPYHLIRNEGHLWLASYYPLPLALVVVWRVLRGQPLWGSRQLDPDRLHRLAPRWRGPVARLAGLLSGRGMWTAFCLAVLATASTYYAVFVLLLLAAAGPLNLARSGDRRRFSGAVVAGATLVAVVLANMLPDMVYEWVNGPNSAALSRDGAATEVYAVKITSLLLPAPGHPIPGFSAFRYNYDETYPVPSESPTLGLVAAVGLLILLVMMVYLLAVPLRRRPEVQSGHGRRDTVRNLAVLTLVALLFATVGGLSTLISFVTPNIRAWNRMAIVLMMFCLAAVGVVLDAWAQRRADRSPLRSHVLFPRVVAAVVLVAGVADQSLTLGVPPYARSAELFESDAAFVQSIEAQVEPGSMIFQLPFVEFPESPSVNGVADADQLRLYLHSDALRWSAGGIRGRPAADWPAVVTTGSTELMVRNLATIGFAGITTDRKRLGDTASQVEDDLAVYTGPAQLVSPDGRYAYFTLAGPAAQLRESTSADQLATNAALLTNPVMGYPGLDFNAVVRQADASWYRVYSSLHEHASMPVVNDRGVPATVHLQLQLGSRTGAPDVTITVGNATLVVQLPAPPPAPVDASGPEPDPPFVDVGLQVTVPAGTSELTFAPGPQTAAELAAAPDPLDMRYTFTGLVFLDDLLLE